METGKVIVEKVRGKSTLTKCFSKYPLKFINPKNVAPSQTDVVWIYAITYGGGIVSGDSIVCDYTIGDGCTTVLTTQASTKVYKAVGTKISEQVLEARIGSNAFLAVIPDPVTCFSTAKYSQKQVFKVMSDSSLLLVDWITSGRHETGEKWNFDLYRSMNNIFHNDDEPLFLDTALLEQGTCSDIAERMQDYQVIAMVILLGPKLKHVQNQIQEDVKKIMSQSLHMPTIGSRQSTSRHNDHHLTKPSFLASCSIFGPKGIGVVTRIAAMTTESVYNFLQHQLSSMEPLLGVKPYSYAS
ncbi:urease accessory protein D isoform X1 [Solanum lycopersicum]|uniref:Urease accessory protein D n=1 Tax=Solanum lycopersicum TaxID=4081 RepID=Q7Y0R8_SOLLC|nr:urease accessory protein D [Solanum lycopersicum]XP_019067524.1 urease accessory protein D isoform X1 [Solanum lycopersicum]XP_019067525.1 urease accessory protein D isoform X1 [Solanum lycopersicum]CAC85464.1 putative urease accessory protein D [Solanum lycopersicum]